MTGPPGRGPILWSILIGSPMSNTLGLLHHSGRAKHDFVSSYRQKNFTPKLKKGPKKRYLYINEQLELFYAWIRLHDSLVFYNLNKAIKVS